MKQTCIFWEQKTYYLFYKSFHFHYSITINKIYSCWFIFIYHEIIFDYKINIFQIFKFWQQILNHTYSYFNNSSMVFVSLFFLKVVKTQNSQKEKLVFAQLKSKSAMKNLKKYEILNSSRDSFFFRFFCVIWWLDS